jgi:hypothetical protein
MNGNDGPDEHEEIVIPNLPPIKKLSLKQQLAILLSDIYSFVVKPTTSFERILSWSALSSLFFSGWLCWCGLRNSCSVNQEILLNRVQKN